MNRSTFPERIRRSRRRRAARRRLAERRRASGAGGGATAGASRLSLILLSLPGLAAVAALLFTWLQVSQSGKELRIIEDQQITTRFNAAIGNLASASLDVRLGGIYALERIMKDSAADQPTIVSVLSAYVRQHAPLPRKTPPTADVRVAMDVLVRRRPERDGGLTLDLSRADLRGWEVGAGTGPAAGHIRLHGADLSGADLSNAILSEADLGQADLEATNLEGADLSQSNLVEAYLYHARLTGTQFIKADLTAATLCAPDVPCGEMNGTDFSGADLSGASLFHADLRKAHLCDREHFIQGPEQEEAETIGCARLSEANLTSADLRGADLRGVDLSEAVLDGADLSGADLTGANLTGTSFEGAVTTGTKGLPAADRSGRSPGR
ncbi:pentapeptide repeat-containing protein [Streptomyces sp. NPDC058583]|uniref:pentapeptide repeat-containing protein n=1 Tax=unclassified Streptomyces TaxID=2593676 RepID=UPI0036508B47